MMSALDWELASGLQDFSGGAFQDFGDAARLSGVAALLAPQRALERVPGAMQLVGSHIIEIADAGKGLAHIVHAAPDPRQRIQDRVRRSAVLGKMRRALLGDAVEFSRRILLDARVADLL